MGRVLWDVAKRTAHAARVSDALRAQESELSLDARRQAVQDAVSAWAKPAPSPAAGGYAWCVDVFDDYVVFRAEGGDLYRVNYTLDADGNATLSGEPEPVKQVTQYEPATVAEGAREIVGDPVELVEGASADGATLIKLIQPGWGSSGYYGDKVLERDGPKAFPKGTHMYWDHPTKTEEKERPERSVRDLAAVLAEDAKYLANGKKGPGLYAKAQVVRTYKNSITDLAPHIGVSIRALGRASKGTVEGRTGDVISELSQGRSVDFVTKAGAGGEVVSLFEAARASAQAADTIPAQQGTREARDMAEATQLAEAQRQLAEANTRNARLAEQLVMRDASAIITEALGKSGLPTISHKRIAEGILRSVPVLEQDYDACVTAKKADGMDEDKAKAACSAAKESRLDRDKLGKAIESAVKDERAYIATLTGRTGAITGMGEGGSSTTTTEAAKTETSFAESLTGIFGMKPETAKNVAGRN
jgi:hypothetical protein